MVCLVSSFSIMVLISAEYDQYLCLKANTKTLLVKQQYHRKDSQRLTVILTTHGKKTESSGTQLYKINISTFVTTVMHAGSYPRI